MEAAGVPITDEANKTLRAGLDIFKSTPVVLAILLFNVIYLVGLFWIAHYALTMCVK